MPDLELVGLVASHIEKRFQGATTLGDWFRGRFARPPVDALQGVDLTLPAGHLLGLAGQNGAGKSTLLRIVAGLVLPDRGTVTVHGHDSAKDDAAYRRLVGYAVSDERSHFWRLSASENLRFFAALHGLGPGAAGERAREILEQVELTGAADRPVREFSSGMRQRLALGRALLGDPRVLLLDEPTRGLDPGSADRFRALVRDELVGRRGMAVVYATHDVLEMRDFCREIVLLRAGRVLDRGTWVHLQPSFEAAFAP